MTSAMTMRKMSLRTMIIGDVDNVVKDDSLGNDKASEDEGLGEGESVEDTEDLGDDDAEDVTEDDDKLDDEDVNVTAVSTCGDRDKITWIHTNIYH